MESEAAGGPSRPTDARSSLQAVAADRDVLADRSRSPGWYHPVLGLGMAAIICTPAVSAVWGFPLVGAAVVVLVLALVLAQRGHRRRTLLSTSRVPGPRSLVTAIIMALVLLAAIVASLVLALADQRSYAPVAVAAGFLAMFPGGLLHDRAYGADVRSAG